MRSQPQETARGDRWLPGILASIVGSYWCLSLCDRSVDLVERDRSVGRVDHILQVHSPTLFRASWYTNRPRRNFP